MEKRPKEQIKVWRLDDIGGLELRSGVAVTEPYPRHWHDEYQFCLIQDGGGELNYRGARHPTPSTSLFIVHPGEVHSNRTETGCSFRSIYLDPDVVQRLASNIVGRAQALPFFSDPTVFDREVIFRYLSLHLAKENSATTLERENALLEMLADLITRHAREKPSLKAARGEHRAVKNVREYIIEHYDRNLSLKELATWGNLSEFHLNRVFTKEVGMPPHAFQTQVRIARAKKLIRSGLSFSSIAAMTGFADQSHFTRHFKRLLKITPGEYLKNSKNVQY